MRLSFKTRLSLWHMAVVALILAGTAVGADWALSRAVLGQIIDGALLALAETEAGALAADPRSPVRIHEMPPGTAPPSFVRLDKFVQIVDLDGRVIARSVTLGTARLPAPGPLLAQLRRGEMVFETLRDFGEEPVRVVSLPVEVAGARYAVQVAMSLDDAFAVLRSARWLFLGMSLAILGGVGLTGGFLARKALQPIDRIVTQARRIGESSLGERLPHPASQDEIGRLVETLNDMLGRIERAFEVQRRFTADASHELRSPLSRLRAELEVTLRRPRENAEYEEALRSCLEEVEHLSSLTEELLTLARLASDEGWGMSAGGVALAPVLEATARRLAAEATRRRVTIMLEPSPSPSLAVRCAPGVVGLVFANVLDNALKFSPPGGQVTVETAADGGDVVVAVSDAGPGIPSDEIPRVFERFYRGSASRSPDSPGVGLGLAICRAVLESQGGQISVESPRGSGATFRVRLPRAI